MESDSRGNGLWASVEDPAYRAIIYPANEALLSDDKDAGELTRMLATCSVEPLVFDRQAAEEFLLDYNCTATVQTFNIVKPSIEAVHAYRRHLISKLSASNLHKMLFNLVSWTFAQVDDSPLHLSRVTMFGPNVCSAYHACSYDSFCYTREPLTLSRPSIVTARGAVLSGTDATAAGPVYQANLIRFIYSQLNIPVVCELPFPLSVHERDFILASSDLCFIGVTPLTHEESVRRLLRENAFGTKRVVMVRDLFDRNLSERPHLSSVFNLLGYSTALVAQQICGQDNLLRRLVTEYQWNGEEYEDIVSDMELSEYLQHAGFKVIQVPESEIKFPEGLNFVSLGKATFIGAKTQSSVISYVKKIHQVEFHTADVQGTLDSLTVVRKPIKHPEPSLVRTAVPSLHMPWASRRDTAALQSTDKILMVAPIGFLSNPQTIIDNHFMKAQHVDAYTIERLALLECSDFHRALTAEGVKVFLNCNEQFYGSPDALFPNNWFSTHPVSEDPNKKENLLVLYPMKAPARRAERREHIVSQLMKRYDRHVTYTHWEESAPNGVFLEGTGSLVIDRVNKVAYLLVSQRADEALFKQWCHRLGYTAVPFRANDSHGRTIYHTNVMMAIGTSVAVLCTESITDEKERAFVVAHLSKTHEIVDITFDQMNAFCGNVLEVRGANGKKLMVMSSRAFGGFTQEQKKTMEKHVDKLLHVAIPTIEDVGGGGVRCMMGELF